MAFIFSNQGCIACNVIELANTIHALGLSAYSVREVLWFFRWSLRASEMILNVRVSNSKRAITACYMY